ncbi:MAG: type I 3-dehydroquinate dehydratase [Candidatus Cloacimonadales bacterium]
MLIYSISQAEDLKEIPVWVEWLELRLDLCAELLNHLDSLTNYKVIITDRWIEEGGKSSRTISEKLLLFKSLLSLPNLAFDLEIAMLEEVGDLGIDFQRVILSNHSFAPFSASLIQQRIKQAQHHKPFFIKLAQKCDSLQELIEFYNLINTYPQPILSVVMGRYSKLQRLLHQQLGSLGTYIVRAGKETVQGQLTLAEVEKFPHFGNNQKFQWGGLIGGEQVDSSIGIDYYNIHFRENNIPAVYLPLHIEEEDIALFFKLIENNRELNSTCYGFSLTMPFKATIPRLFSHSQISNLLIWGEEKRFYNSDRDAFMAIKQKLQQFPIDNILIYGSGSMARLAIEVFQDYKITLTARSKTKLAELRKEYELREIIDQISPSLYFDLMINCSSLGMNGESFSEETGINKFKYVIDLPYSQVEIPLQLEVGEKYISGREFWRYQSEKQLQLFKESIENDKE